MPAQRPRPPSPVPEDAPCVQRALTVADVAELTGLDQEDVLAEIRSGRLQATRIRGRYLTTARRYESWLDPSSEPFPHQGLVSADRVSELLGVDRSWVYDNKIELGVVRLGRANGPLRFEAAAVHAYVQSKRLAREQRLPARGRRPGPGRAEELGFELLPLPDEED